MLREFETTDDGRPLHPRSIFICIQRAQLPSRELIDESLQTGRIVNMPIKFDGCWDNIIGAVRQVRSFADGMLVLLDGRFKGSMLESWDCVPLWIPMVNSVRVGSAGVLAKWRTNSQ